MYIWFSFAFLCSFPEYELEEKSRDMEAKQETIGKSFVLLTHYYQTGILQICLD